MFLFSLVSDLFCCKKQLRFIHSFEDGFCLWRMEPRPQRDRTAVQELPPVELPGRVAEGYVGPGHDEALWYPY